MFFAFVNLGRRGRLHPEIISFLEQKLVHLLVASVTEKIRAF
jgi:hypothetical protein